MAWSTNLPDGPTDGWLNLTSGARVLGCGCPHSSLRWLERDFHPSPAGTAQPTTAPLNFQPQILRVVIPSEHAATCESRDLQFTDPATNPGAPRPDSGMWDSRSLNLDTDSTFSLASQGPVEEPGFSPASKSPARVPHPFFPRSSRNHHNFGCPILSSPRRAKGGRRQSEGPNLPAPSPTRRGVRWGGDQSEVAGGAFRGRNGNHSTLAQGFSVAPEKIL